MQSGTATSDWNRRQVLMAVSWFAGFLGLDRFYQQQPLWGILKLITFGGVGIWWIIDAIYYTVLAGER